MADTIPSPGHLRLPEGIVLTWFCSDGPDGPVASTFRLGNEPTDYDTGMGLLAKHRLTVAGEPLYGPPAPVKNRFLIDTHLVDEMLDNGSALTSVSAALRERRIDVLVTHIQIDEALAVPDVKASRRQDLIQTLSDSGVRRVPTGILVLDTSRLDHARLADDEMAARFRKEINEHPDRINDAILVFTAEFERATFVSRDRGARGTANRLGWPHVVPMKDWFGRLALVEDDKEAA